VLHLARIQESKAALQEQQAAARERTVVRAGVVPQAVLVDQDLVEVDVAAHVAGLVDRAEPELGDAALVQPVRRDPAHPRQHRADVAVALVDVLLELDAHPLADRQLEMGVVLVPALAFHVGHQHDAERVDPRQHEARLGRRRAAVELRQPHIVEIVAELHVRADEQLEPAPAPLEAVPGYCLLQLGVRAALAEIDPAAIGAARRHHPAEMALVGEE
jgi:hypothetical protein